MLQPDRIIIASRTGLNIMCAQYVKGSASDQLHETNKNKHTQRSIHTLTQTQIQAQHCWLLLCVQFERYFKTFALSSLRRYLDASECIIWERYGGGGRKMERRGNMKKRWQSNTTVFNDFTDKEVRERTKGIDSKQYINNNQTSVHVCGIWYSIFVGDDVDDVVRCYRDRNRCNVMNANNNNNKNDQNIMRLAACVYLYVIICILDVLRCVCKYPI